MATETENGAHSDVQKMEATSPWARLEEEKDLGPIIKFAEPMVHWTRARTQALAMKEREAKRAKAERELKKKRDAEQMLRRRDFELATRQQNKIGQSSVDTAEQERLEARKRMNERLETIIPHAFEEVWDVNS